ncbi:MAG TPA: hypothetical protein VKT49_16920 [Bryobacteraceae bacterium]|nr:hypothetical protein [Bryobacteraceae bacterium]
MAVVWSREFLITLLCFLTPTVIAALLVYRRVAKSQLVRRRKRKAVTEAVVRQVLEQAQPTIAPLVAQQETAAASHASLQESLENLRRCLVEFRGSLQHSRSALGELHDRDCEFSEDLGRASEVMHHAFSK